MRPTRRIGAVAALSAVVAVLAIAPSAGAATFTVNTKLDTDDGACTTAVDGCSLHDAVTEANNAAGPDEVVLPAGRYVFDPQGTGSLIITDTSGTTTITGAGAATTIIDSNGLDSVVVVRSGVSFAASGVTLTGGVSSGGVTTAEDSSTALTDARVTRNHSDETGGGINNFEGDVTLTRVEVDHNTSDGPGGGIENFNGFVHVVDSWIHANQSWFGGGGIDVFAGKCGCSEQPPTQLGPSGKAGEVTVENSTISDNFTHGPGGAINASGLDQQQGEDAAVTSEGTAVVTVTNSTISGNTAAAIPFCECEFPSEGGGLSLTNTTGSLTNDTIYGNSAIDEGGGADGGGLYVGSEGSGSDVSIVNTILDENLAAGVVENCSVEADELHSLGHNLESGDTCGFTATGDQTETDPKLGSLRDNGGLTPTHKLLDGSPAIDTADNGAGPATDQRGGHRPPGGGSAGDTRDIGAYEAYSLADLTVEVKFDAPDPATVGKPLTYSMVVRNNGPDRINGVTLSDPLPSGVAPVSASSSQGSCTIAVACSLGSIDPGAFVTVQVTITPDAPGSRTNTGTVSATGYTETNPSNDAASATTAFVAAPPTLQPTTPGGETEKPADKTIVLNFKAPEQITLDEFMDGFVVEADCGDEQCLRRFREHASINTGATHIAGFNLTVSRTSLGFKGKTRIRLKPCVSGSSNGKAHKRCIRNLRKAAKKALPFRVKVVCSAIDHADNRVAKKLFVKVVDN
jgi:uncharacterized repeat protein (TIGR01451 family)